METSSSLLHEVIAPSAAECTNQSEEGAAPIASEVQEPQDDPMKTLLAAVKRRRRSSVFVPPVAAETGAGSTPEIASAITEKRRKSISAARRSSMTRRSLCSAPSAVCSISDQVGGVMTNGKATVSQLVDICIRDSIAQLCRDQPSHPHIPALKSILVLNSEQVSEEVGDQLASEGITTARLLPKTPQSPLRTARLSNTCNLNDKNVANSKKDVSHKESGCTKIGLEEGICEAEKKASDIDVSAGSDKENVGGSRKRKIDACSKNSSKGDKISPKDDHGAVHKRRLISEYERKTELLRAEHKAWKLLKVQRREQHSAAKREYAESRSGQQRIGEEQASFLNVAQKAFLEGAPDYGRCLQQLGRVSEESLYAAAVCESKVSRLCAVRTEVNAAADRAYYLADAAVYNEDQFTLRSQLDELSC